MTMLQPIDDYPFHQTAQTFDTPFTDDARWFDRFWFMTGNVEERICLITGLGTYPNAKLMDGYAMLCDGSSQWNLRVGRPHGDDALSLGAEGLTFELVEPMTRWRLACERSEELGFSLEFEHRYEPNHLPSLYVEKDGHVIMEMGHFAQSGAMTGWLQLGERRIEVTGWPGERDRSWGRRPASGKVRSGIHVWLPAQVGRRMIWLWFRENARGERLGLEGIIRDLDGGSKRVVEFKHEIEVVEDVPPHRQLVHARLDLTLDDGEHLVVEVEPVIPVFIAGGGYIEGALAQGTFTGRQLTRWDNTGAGRSEIPVTIIDHFSRVTVDGEVGQGVFELSMGRYEPLGFGPPGE
jgi:hypothetical protein